MKRAVKTVGLLVLAAAIAAGAVLIYVRQIVEPFAARSLAVATIAIDGWLVRVAFTDRAERKAARARAQMQHGELMKAVQALRKDVAAELEAKRLANPETQRTSDSGDSAG